MLYAILCYQPEGEVCAMSPEQDAALMTELLQVKARLNATSIQFGPTARLMPTSAAVTVREGKQPMVIDGPFAETKEQLLGFYTLECGSLEQAIEAAKALNLPRAKAGLAGALEIRPVHFFDAGT